MAIQSTQRYGFDLELESDGAVWLARGPVRVVLTAEDGTDVYVFTTEARSVLDYSISLRAGTPAPVIEATIAGVLKDLGQ